MKNKKFLLQLSLEDEKELMDEIDAVLRERAISIVREEAESLIGGAVRDEANRIAKQKIDSMGRYDAKEAFCRAVAGEIRNNSDIRGVVKNEFVSWLIDDQNFFMKQTVKDAVEKYVNTKLGASCPSDVIKSVCDTLLKK